MEPDAKKVAIQMVEQLEDEGNSLYMGMLYIAHKGLSSMQLALGTFRML